MTTLYVRDGLTFREADSHDVIRQAQTLISRSFRPGAPLLSRPEQVREFLRLRLGSLDHEVFCCFYLDTHRLKDLLALMDVHVLDHMIVGDNGCYSMSEHGLI